jgi:aminoglycoside phosphotransferase family enzyme/predicted kinase
MGNTSDSSQLLIEALCSKTNVYDHEIFSVRLVETHISWVLLTGKYAYKIKKPVSFGFLDFSTLEQRHFFCREEIRLNRRLAANIYLEVVPITGTPGDPKMGGTGNIIEYAVKMNQFSDGHLLSERAESDDLSVEEIDQIAYIVAEFHENIEKENADSLYGDASDIKHWFDENFDQIRPLLKEDYCKQQLQRIQHWGNEEWSSKSALMQCRKQQGFVRECHGDLHLSNITLINGKVTLFDCIEFNPKLRWIDVINEVAFLVIDLLYFGYESYAFRFLNRYLQYSGDYQGFRLVRYYLVYRAMVLAKVTLLRMEQCLGSEYEQAFAKFSAFMNLAERFTRQDRAVLIITHGYSGSGKSTVAGQCAETMGAVLIRSDVERKRLFRYRAQDNTGSYTDSGIYTDKVGIQTYQLLAGLVRFGIQEGFSVIVDATFLKNWQRELFRQVANELAVEFLILDCQAPDAELESRIRQRTNDASEATVEVLRHQQQSAEPLSREELAYAVTIDMSNTDALDNWLQRFIGTPR